jgi:hypothetical protein
MNIQPQPGDMINFNLTLYQQHTTENINTYGIITKIVQRDIIRVIYFIDNQTLKEEWFFDNVYDFQVVSAISRKK